MDATFEGAIQQELIDLGIEEAVAKRILGYAESSAKADTDRTTFQAMEALVHNLNTMHSRAGAQTRSLRSTTVWIRR